MSEKKELAINQDYLMENIEYDFEKIKLLSLK